MRLAATVVAIVTAVVTVLVAAAAEAEPPEPKRLSLDLENASLETVVKAVTRHAAVRVEVAPSAKDERITIRVKDRTADEILREAAKLAGVPLAVLADGSFLLGVKKNPSVERIRKALEETRLSLRCESTDFQGVLTQISDKVGVPILLDPVVGEGRQKSELQVTLNVDRIKALNALQILCAMKTLEHDVRWGVVVVSSQDQLARLPRHLVPLPAPGVKESEKDRLTRSRLATKRVTFTLVGTALPDLVFFLAKLSGVNIVLAPSVVEKAQEAEVTWQVRDVTVEAALALLITRHGLRARLKDGVLVIESAVAAAKPGKR